MASDRRADAVFALYVFCVGFLAAPVVHRFVGHSAGEAEFGSSGAAPHDESRPHDHSPRESHRHLAGSTQHSELAPVELEPATPIVELALSVESGEWCGEAAGAAQALAFMEDAQGP